MAMHKRVPRGQHNFGQAPNVSIPRSKFNRSFGHKTTFDAGRLVPIFVDEALPGDTFSVRTNGFVRLATPIKPIMDNLYLDTFFFAVPYRLVWHNWAKFNGEQASPGDSTDFLVPTFGGVDAVMTGSVADYMGVPIGLNPALHNVSALPIRAYRLIWNEWFRDQNLQPSIDVRTNEGPDPVGYLNEAPLRRGKRHDYFTSALPWPQKGPSVELPLGSEAPVGNWTAAPGATLGAYNGTIFTQIGTSGAAAVKTGTLADTGLYADLSAATAATINQIRQAFQVQKLLERDARGGTRYTEIIRAHFGVTSPDQRLQRPEYLGGGSTPIIVTPIAQTSSTDATTPKGDLSGVATASISGHGFSQSFTEHCLVIGLASVRADLSYQQGLHRMWTRRTRYDFYWPALSHIGEQAIYNREIFVSNTAADSEVFGYQERYAEYRYAPSMVTGLFRSAAVGSIDIWHLAQDFLTTPALNASFIEENPPIDRVIAVPSEPHFIADFYFRFTAARPMPLYGVPGLIDHF